MENTTNLTQQHFQAIAQLPLTTQVNPPRRQWSAGVALKNTMGIGSAYPNYESSYYWPKYEDGQVRYFLGSRNRDEHGELHSFQAVSDTLEGALVMLNEKLRRFFLKGDKTATSTPAFNELEQLIFTDLRTETAA